MRKLILTIIASVVVLMGGTLGMLALASLKKEPAKVEEKELALSVAAVRVSPREIPVAIKGFGEAKALNAVAISPEVSGQVIEIHPNLEVGGVVPMGEILFRIDPRDYQARYDEAKASLSQTEAILKRLETQYATDRERLKTLARTRDLAQTDFQRKKELLEKDQVGTKAGVDAAEQISNQAADGHDLLSQTVAMYPMRIDEARGALDSTRAMMENARANLERTTVTAPFNARVKSVNLERNQYVALGAQVLTLADDSVLEILVSLDSRQARQWLKFSNDAPAGDTAWFGAPEPVTCTVRWTEDREAHCWLGKMVRVAEFAPETRTMTVAVQVMGSDARSNDAAALPLVEGMYCSVEIPGQVIPNAYEIPVGAVTFDNKVYKAVDGRLKSVPVTVAHTQGDSVIVIAGIDAGDLIVTTRLSNPLENSLLDITVEDEPQGNAA
ncbi:MAG: HlyD family efflux transporter periplasmic adaptor subunit [Candidatus Hydrogenedentales bacterium]|jgi:multidrug efflux pump subunit AcrA (membrane-fusion protein)